MLSLSYVEVVENETCDFATKTGFSSPIALLEVCFQTQPTNLDATLHLKSSLHKEVNIHLWTKESKQQLSVTFFYKGGVIFFRKQQCDWQKEFNHTILANYWYLDYYFGISNVICNFPLISPRLFLEFNWNMSWRYCPPNETINKYWIDHGMNICFLETVTSSTILGFILVFGSIQLLLYWRHGSRLLDGKCLIFRNQLLPLKDNLAILHIEIVRDINLHYS